MQSLISCVFFWLFQPQNFCFTTSKLQNAATFENMSDQSSINSRMETNKTAPEKNDTTQGGSTLHDNFSTVINVAINAQICQHVKLAAPSTRSATRRTDADHPKRQNFGQVSGFCSKNYRAQSRGLSVMRINATHISARNLQEGVEREEP